MKYRRLRTGGSGHGYWETAVINFIVPKGFSYELSEKVDIVSWLELK